MGFTAKTAERIRGLQVQGARNIARAGLEALIKDTNSSKAKTTAALLRELEANARKLATARPTEPALRNGLNSVLKAAKYANGVSECKDAVKRTATAYADEMERAIKEIARIGEKRISDGDKILTHCHSSTVMAVLKAAKAEGRKFEVWCTETRPFWQGRTTAKELLAAKIPATMIVDSAARRFMNDFQLVLVGADAVTSEGFVVNKIGTGQILLAAKEARTTVGCTCETFKFDPMTRAGDWEPIEERSPKEVWDKPPKGLRIRNPAFDMTPPNLIDFMITEEGIISPFEVGMIMREKYE
jgi:ribose 1,5-bisphosphate isomerase